MDKWLARKIKEHFGHHIVIAKYGDPDEPADICIECEDCCCVILSLEDYGMIEED